MLEAQIYIKNIKQHLTPNKFGGEGVSSLNWGVFTPLGGV